MAAKDTSALDQLSEPQKRFVMEYAADLDKTRAAKEAGYKGNLRQRGTRLLESPKVKAAIREVLKPKMDQDHLTVENIQSQLSRFLFRNLLPYLDDAGNLTCSLKDLPEEVQQCVDGVKIDREYDKKTGELLSEKIDLKFVSKAKAIELAMRYRSMLGESSNNVNINVGGINVEGFWKDFHNSANTNPPNLIEAKFKEITGDDLSSS